MAERVCVVVEGGSICAGDVGIVQGMCPKHYTRWRKYGDPLYAKQIRGDDEARFWSKVDRAGDDECWLWTDAPVKSGYGSFGVGQKKYFAHRWAYERFVGPIPEGYQLDHVYANGCRHLHCVNYLRHLEPVTNRENTLRGRKTKLSDDRAVELLDRHLAGEGLRALAREVGLNHMTLSRRFVRLTTS